MNAKPHNLGDEKHGSFRCPVCNKNHFFSSGEFVNGTIEMECTDNATSEVKAFHGVKKDDYLFPTDGTHSNPLYLNPYSRRENAYKNPSLKVKEIIGRNTKYAGGKNTQNW